MRKPWYKKKGLRVTLVIVLVLGGLLVVADRVAASIAEDKVAKLIAQEAANRGVAMTTEPDVDMGGWPFVTQVFGGEYEQIDITFHDLTTSGVTLPQLDVHAVKVAAELSNVMNGAGPVVAQSMSAEARMTYDAISNSLTQAGTAVQVTSDGGKLKITATLNAAGIAIPVEGVADVKLTDNAVSVQVTEMKAVGVQVPPQAQSKVTEFQNTLNREIPLPPLPYDLRLSDLQVNADGVVLSASATEVPLV